MSPSYSLLDDVFISFVVLEDPHNYRALKKPGNKGETSTHYYMQFNYYIWYCIIRGGLLLRSLGPYTPIFFY